MNKKWREHLMSLSWAERLCSLSVGEEVRCVEAFEYLGAHEGEIEINKFFKVKGYNTPHAAKGKTMKFQHVKDGYWKRIA